MKKHWLKFGFYPERARYSFNFYTTHSIGFFIKKQSQIKIGLYNPNGDLIAVGKLASAIQNRSDVDITVKVRFDLDGPFGTPTTGSLEPVGRPATITKTKDGRFIWNKFDRPNIGVNE